jgi:hypothetical protein
VATHWLAEVRACAGLTIRLYLPHSYFTKGIVVRGLDGYELDWSVPEAGRFAFSQLFGL